MDSKMSMDSIILKHLLRAPLIYLENNLEINKFGLSYKLSYIR